MRTFDRNIYIEKIKEESEGPLVSKNTVDNYRNNIEFLRDLQLKIKSGSCTRYDMQLYRSLSGNKTLTKKLTMQN